MIFSVELKAFTAYYVISFIISFLIIYYYWKPIIFAWNYREMLVKIMAVFNVLNGWIVITSAILVYKDNFNQYSTF